MHENLLTVAGKDGAGGKAQGEGEVIRGGGEKSRQLSTRAGAFQLVL